MARGLSHQSRKNHPAEPLGGRRECKSSYAGPGRIPQHPLVVLARSEEDLLAKRERAGRGEMLYRDDDVLDDPSAGLLVQRSEKGIHPHGNGLDVVTGEVGDTRQETHRSTRLPSCWDSLSLGSRLKMLRHSLGYSCRRLAELAHVNNYSLKKWECNACRPTIDLLIRLATFFNVSPGILLDGLGEDCRISGG